MMKIAAWIAAATLTIAIILCIAISAQAQAAQQTTITWEAYVEPAIVPPSAMVPLSLAFAGYQINWGTGAGCNAIGSQLGTALTFIPKTLSPGVTPTSFIHTGYPDTASIICYEVFVKFADNTFSLRSKRLFKEIISTKPIVTNPQVQ